MEDYTNMNDYAVINGKKIPLTAQEVNNIISGHKVDFFDVAKQNTNFYYISSSGRVCSQKENYGIGVKNLINIANYCTNKKIMEQRALHETLDRLLWRFSLQNDGNKIDWKNMLQNKYNIYFDHETKRFVIDCDVICHFSTPYFKDEQTAQQAINSIIKPFMKNYPKFVW